MEVALIWHLAIVRSSTAEDCVGVRVGALGSLSVLSDKELAALADHTPALSNGLQRANLKGSGVEATAVFGRRPAKFTITDEVRPAAVSRLALC